jgi:glucose/arabinose dehydrogenase/mono/diheme cytochrome c family protein
MGERSTTSNPQPAVWAIGAALASLLMMMAFSSRGAAQPTEDFDWRSNWGVEDGFTLDIDTTGYQLPTAIAFVPDPGTEPEDPLYFVTELRGAIKVVANDRTVRPFAQVDVLAPLRELPASEGQGGLAGICLDATRGYVFVTFSYRDQAGLLRNNIVRYEVAAGTFSGEPRGEVAFTEVFAPYESALSHQIGGCQVEGDALYVSVGDAGRSHASAALEQLLGKVVRMTLDGMPHPGNPFEDTPGGGPYVWAYGLRNPFGLRVVDGEVFVVDNGPSVDRFLRLEAGGDYQWDGSDWSIGSVADAVLSPGVGPVHLDYLPRESSLFPAGYTGSFFFGASGSSPAATKPGIVMVPYDLDQRRTEGTPRYVVEFRGTDEQFVSGVAFGPDGLYLLPILPDTAGDSPILKMSYAPERGHPFGIGQTGEGYQLMVAKGCFACHSYEGQGGNVGPPLDRNSLVVRVRDRLNSEAYAAQLAQIDQIDEEPYRSYREARRQVLEAEGGQKIRLWMTYRIVEPRFDNTTAQMPNQGVTEEEAAAMVDFLMAQPGARPASLVERIARRLFGSRLAALGFGAGVAFSLVVLALAYGAWWLIRRRRQESPAAGQATEEGSSRG